MPPLIARVLFTADRLETDKQPEWYYIDDAEAYQGPFTASSMLQWWQDKYLKKDLLMCGVEPGSFNTAPKDPNAYEKLMILLARTKQHHYYEPLTPEKLRSLPPKTDLPSRTRSGTLPSSAFRAATDGPGDRGRDSSRKVIVGPTSPDIPDRVTRGGFGRGGPGGRGGGGRTLRGSGRGTPDESNWRQRSTDGGVVEDATRREWERRHDQKKDGDGKE